MKKFFKLCSDFAGSAALYIVFITLICAVIFCAVTFVCGKYIYISDCYDALADAGVENDIYFTKTMRSRADDEPQLRDAILGTDGVIGVVGHPYTVNNNSYVNWTEDFDAGASLMRYDRELYEMFPPELLDGDGFDYSSSEPECIITDKSMKCVPRGTRVGDRIEIKYLTSDRQIKTFPIKVAGIAAANRFYPTMTGGGDGSDATFVMSQVDSLIIKYSPLTKDAIDGAFGDPATLPRYGVYCAFIKTDGRKIDGIMEALAPLSEGGRSVVTGAVILEQTKADMDDTIRSYLPVALFSAVFFITTIVCLVTLSVHRFADTITLWRIAGASRKTTFCAVTLTFAASIAAALLLTYISTRIVIGTELSALPIFSECILTPSSMLPASALGIFTIAAAAAITFISGRGGSLRGLFGKYGD